MENTEPWSKRRAETKARREAKKSNKVAHIQSSAQIEVSTPVKTSHTYVHKLSVGRAKLLAEKRSEGRPQREPKQEEFDRIVALVEGGLSPITAAGHEGVSATLISRWLQQYDTFAQAIKRAEDRCENLHVQVIKKAALNGNWPASGWWLERTRPEKYANKQELRQTIQHNTAIVVVDAKQCASLATSFLDFAKQSKVVDVQPVATELLPDKQAA